MQVIDINHELIREFVSDTLNKLKIIEGERVNLIGIASGGVPIADLFEEALLKKTTAINRIDIQCRRPSTKEKKSSTSVAKLIKYIPKPALNLLRVVEHHFLSKSRNPKRELLVLHHSKIEEIYDSAKTIIVDDAIDSGFSLLSVKKYLQEFVNKNNIYIAVIVCTQKDPVVTPNFFLLENALVRFPWSLDAKH